MNSKSIKAISNICSGQTVLTLLVAYLIILFYIIPSAHTEALSSSGAKINSGSLFGYCKLEILSQYEFLTDDSKSNFVSTEFTAGIFEDFSLFALLIALQFFVKNKTDDRHAAFVPMLRLTVLAFSFDLIQSFTCIYLMSFSTFSQILMTVIIVLAIAKITVYTIVSLKTIYALVISIFNS